jgi:hypothetical protein
LPTIFIDYFFAVIVDVIDWRCQDLPLFSMAKGMKDGGVTDTEAIRKLVVIAEVTVNPECEFGLSNGCPEKRR